MTIPTRSHNEHKELGDVNWHRDFDEAVAQAGAQKKPILLLFQEVPGCSTCVNFGQDVLSHPLLVEAIETLFIPLAVFNNHPGPDEKILRRFQEPSWNNPVVHILDNKGAPLTARLSDRYEALALHRHMTDALQHSGVHVPDYFSLLRGDLLIEGGIARTATYATPCFWSGETSLALNDAVIATQAGWIGGEEVVRVHYDPDSTNEVELDDYARDQQFTPIKDTNFEPDAEPQFYLRKTHFRYLPLTRSQATKINVAHPYGEDAETYLSPRQREALVSGELEKISDPETYRLDIRNAWKNLDATRAMSR